MIKSSTIYRKDYSQTLIF